MNNPEMSAAPVIPGVDAPGGDRCNPSLIQKGKVVASVIDTPQPAPQVPLPPGAIPSNDPAEWSMWDNECRVVYGREHVITGAKITVQTSAVQRADGSIEGRDEANNKSGPSVSVQAHWEDYLTGDQARELAGRILDAAAQTDRWREPGTSEHGCAFGWCTTPEWQSRNTGEHWGVVYYPATLQHGDLYHLTEGHSPLRIGIGVTYDEGYRPAVVVHLDGGQYDYDDDAFCRVDEAIQIRDALSRAIVDATAALRHAIAAEIGGDR